MASSVVTLAILLRMWALAAPAEMLIGFYFVLTGIARFAEEHLRGKGTIDFAMDLIEHAEVNISPGGAFGEGGEGYMRIALVENEQRLRQAIRNISRFVHEKPIRKAKAAK